MITTKQADEIIEAVMERVEVNWNGTSGRDDAYPNLPNSDRNKLISIIKDIVRERK